MQRKGMNTTMKKLLSSAMAAAMFLSSGANLPLTAFSADEENTVTTETTTADRVDEGLERYQQELERCEELQKNPIPLEETLLKWNEYFK